MIFNKLNKNFLKFSALIFSVFFLFSCASSKSLSNQHFDTSSEFTKKYLSNGIPVVFRQNKNSKIVVLKLVFDGGNSVLDEKYGGMENLTLDLMTRGSEKFPYSIINQYEYEKSIFLSSGAGRDYSTIGFTCIQRDLELSINMFSDCVLNPAFLESDFSRKMTEASADIIERKNNPSGLLGLTIAKNVFKNHPYATTGSITEESYPNITLEKIKENHKNLLNSNRMKFVVIGNFSGELISDFLAMLENHFSSIKKASFPLPKISKLNISKGTYLIPNEQAGNTGYIAGVFEYPNRSSDECISLAIALMYLDDILFSQVREKAGAVYSINTDVIGGKELLGVLSVYKATEKTELKKLIYDAVLSFDSAEMERKLNQYKNRYISTLFSSSQTSSGLASNVIFSMEYFGSETASLKRSDAVQKIKAKQVISAYKKYIESAFKEDKVLWFVVDGKDNLEKYNF